MEEGKKAGSRSSLLQSKIPCARKLTGIPAI